SALSAWIGLGALACPPQRPAHGRTPPPVRRVVAAARFEPLVELPGRCEFIGPGPDAGGQPGQKGRPEAGRLGNHRPLHWYLKLIGRDLHQQVIGRCTAVDPQWRTSRTSLASGASLTSRTSVTLRTSLAAGASLCCHHVHDIAHLERDRFERRTGEM